MTTKTNSDAYITTIIDIVGASDEIKPIVLHENYLISSGSIYKENDTGKTYMYNQEKRKWYLLQD